MSHAAAFYCVTGRDFFPGAVAMLNSLRTTGHTEPLYVLDAGMDRWQRDALEHHATIVDPPSGAPPSLQKLVAPRHHPAETMVLLDADLIVTRPLGELIARAAAGSVVAFRNDVQRHFPEWGDLLDLGPVRPGAYVTTSAILAGGEPATRLFEAVAERQATVDRGRTWLGDGDERDPLYYLDQDVLNAVAHSLLGPGDLVALDRDLAPIPPFEGVRIVDEGTLRCARRDGTEPYLLHHCFRKPWLVRMRSNVYSRLLTRLLLSADVPLRLEPERLPLRLRSGAGGTATRIATDVVLTPPGAVRRLRRRRAKVTAWPGSSSA